MPTTANYALRYAASTDPAEIHTHTKNLADDVDAKLTQRDAAWATSAMTLTATTTNPTNWTATYARHRKAGRTVSGRFKFTAGAAYTPGSGNYLITLPTAPAADYAPGDVVGIAWARNAAAGTLVAYQVCIYDSTRLQLIRTSSGVALDHTGPWSVGGYFTGTYAYESAA